jgi:hypothetical protein
MKVVLLLGVLFCAAGSVQASENRGPYQGLIDNAGHLSDGERLKQLFQLDWDREYDQAGWADDGGSVEL